MNCVIRDLRFFVTHDLASAGADKVRAGVAKVAIPSGVTPHSYQGRGMATTVRTTQFHKGRSNITYR